MGAKWCCCLQSKRGVVASYTQLSEAAEDRKVVEKWREEQRDLAMHRQSLETFPTRFGERYHNYLAVFYELLEQVRREPNLPSEFVDSVSLPPTADEVASMDLRSAVVFTALRLRLHSGRTRLAELAKRCALDPSPLFAASCNLPTFPRMPCRCSFHDSSPVPAVSLAK